ncbi:MAG: TlpA family protein disulfide reductase [candidate division Zixibacteria bacterium]|nr:TlpA family protein disulfide reductase [Candidatus Tariuqbacter arcticus]
MNRYILTLTLIIFIFAGFSSAEDFSAVNFTLDDIDGGLFILEDHLGEGPVLINFWATWCTPCKHELPHLQKLFEQYEEQGFLVITISEDTPKSQSKVKPYVRSRRFTFPVLLDPNGDVLRLFQGSSLPYQVLLDRQGNIIETHQGYSPGDEKVLEEKIVKLLEAESVDE